MVPVVRELLVLALSLVYSTGHLSLYSRGPFIVPVARYSACQVVGDRWEEPAVEVCGAVPVAAIVPIFPSIVHIPALQRDH